MTLSYAFARVFSLGLIALFLASCSNDSTNTYLPLEVLHIGVLPDQEKAVLKKKYAPLIAYLSKQLDIPCKLVVPDSYNDLVEEFHHGDINLAYFGGATFLIANQKSGAVPLVIRDVDAHFTSYFIVPSGTDFETLPDLKGKKISFGSRLSTSGHLMPRYYLHQRDITPEDFFSVVRYSGTHDATAKLVSDGSVDVGAVNSVIIDRMFEDGRLARDKVRIIWETPPYLDYVWALKPNTSEDFKNELRQAFLRLSPSDDQDMKVLSSLSSSIFLPVTLDEFHRLREAGTLVGILPDQSGTQ